MLPTIADTNWEVQGGGDFDANGTTDFIWRNKSTGQDIAWLMDVGNGHQRRVPADDCRHELGRSKASATSTATGKRTSSCATSRPGRTWAG